MMDDATAQVTPLELTTAMMDNAIKNGAKLVTGTCKGVKFASGSEKKKVVEAIIVDDQTIPCDCAVFTLGPWSTLCEDWFPGFEVPMTGIKSSSVIWNPEEEVQAAVLFCGEDRNGCHLEVYPRPDGGVYVCGLGGSDNLRKKEIDALAPEKVAPNPKRVEAATKSFNGMSSILNGKPPSVTQACMRPCPDDGLPMIGLIPKTANAYMAAGHNCWGILWGPVTGLLVSELVADGKTTTIKNLKPFDPARFS